MGKLWIWTSQFRFQSPGMELQLEVGCQFPSEKGYELGQYWIYQVVRCVQRSAVHPRSVRGGQAIYSSGALEHPKWRSHISVGNHNPIIPSFIRFFIPNWLSSDFSEGSTGSTTNPRQGPDRRNQSQERARSSARRWLGKVWISATENGTFETFDSHKWWFGTFWDPNRCQKEWNYKTEDVFFGFEIWISC